MMSDQTTTFGWYRAVISRCFAGASQVQFRWVLRYSGRWKVSTTSVGWQPPTVAMATPTSRWRRSAASAWASWLPVESPMTPTYGAPELCRSARRTQTGAAADGVTGGGGPTGVTRPRASAAPVIVRAVTQTDSSDRCRNRPAAVRKDRSNPARSAEGWPGFRKAF
jgi:hypothetical protein